MAVTIDDGHGDGGDHMAAMAMCTAAMTAVCDVMARIRCRRGGCGRSLTTYERGGQASNDPLQDRGLEPIHSSAAGIGDHDPGQLAGTGGDRGSDPQEDWGLKI